MSNLDDLIEAARTEHADIDRQIYELRKQRAEINAQIKELTVRKTRAARVVLASQPRRRKAKATVPDE